MANSPHIVNVDSTNFNEIVVEGSAKQPVLVDVWADWCGPCKSLMPILEKLTAERDGAFILAKLDGDANQEMVQQMGVRGYPTVRLFKDKKAVDEFSGALPEKEVRRFLDHHLGANDAPPA